MNIIKLIDSFKKVFFTFFTTEESWYSLCYENYMFMYVKKHIFLKLTVFVVINVIFHSKVFIFELCIRNLSILCHLHITHLEYSFI